MSPREDQNPKYVQLSLHASWEGRQGDPGSKGPWLQGEARAGLGNLVRPCLRIQIKKRAGEGVGT